MALNQLFNDYPTIQILLETMAGKGSEVGITFQEIKNIIDLIEKKECIGVCLDTCHIQMEVMIYHKQMNFFPNLIKSLV